MRLSEVPLGGIVKPDAFLKANLAGLIVSRKMDYRSEKYSNYEEYRSMGVVVYLSDPRYTGDAAYVVRQAETVDVLVLESKDLPEAYQLALKLGRRANATTGFDPEIFVTVDDKLFPAFEFLPSKDEAKKHQINEMYSYWDGFQAEFAAKARSCHGYGIDGLRDGLKDIWTKARRKNPKAKLSIKNLFKIPVPMLQETPLEYVSFGCKPSENAYGLEPVFVLDPREMPMRCAGGHIHFGSTDYHYAYVVQEHGPALDIHKLMKTEQAKAIVKVLDRFLGVPCVALFDGIDKPGRRQLYGRAGEYRTPSYGLEYRVLSNAWLCHPAISHLVLNTARAALSLRGNDLSGLSDEETQEIINNCDAHRARHWIEKNWMLFSMMIGHDMGSTVAAEKSKRFWLGGVVNEVKGYDDLTANWILDGEWGHHSNTSKATWSAYANTVPSV